MIKEINNLEIINKYLNKFNQAISNLENPFEKYIGYIVNDEIVAFLNYSLIYDRIEIDYIYTNENYRNQNIASQLVDYVISEGMKNNCSNITLEVRKSNKVALNFYYKNGFKEVSIRKKYYSGEDAILMLRELV